jgi:hypothetical protein
MQRHLSTRPTQIANPIWHNFARDMPASGAWCHAGALLIAGSIILCCVCRRLKHVSYVELTHPGDRATRPMTTFMSGQRSRAPHAMSHHKSSARDAINVPESLSSNSSRIPLDPHGCPESFTSSSHLTFLSQGLHAPPTPSAFVIGGHTDESSDFAGSIVPLPPPRGGSLPSTPGFSPLAGGNGLGASFCDKSLLEGMSEGGLRVRAVKNSLANAVHTMHDVLQEEESSEPSAVDDHLQMFTMIGRGSSGTVYHGVPPLGGSGRRQAQKHFCLLGATFAKLAQQITIAGSVAYYDRAQLQRLVDLLSTPGPVCWAPRCVGGDRP